MKTVLDIMVIAVACFAAGLVYVVAQQLLEELNLVNAPKFISFAVAMLSLLAIVELGRGVVFLLLIPYAALGLSLVVLYIISLFPGTTNNKNRRPIKCCCQSFERILRTCIRRIQEKAADFRSRK